MRRLKKILNFDHRRCPYNTRAGAVFGVVVGLAAGTAAAIAGGPAGLLTAVLMFTAVAIADWRFHASR